MTRGPRLTPKKPRKLKEWDASVATGSKRGACLNHQSQGATFSVYKFFQMEAILGTPLIFLHGVRDRVGAALDISKDKVSDCVKIGEKNWVWVTPGKFRPRFKIKRDIDEDTKFAIRNDLTE